MTVPNVEPPQFPGAVGLTWLRVYDSVAPDGVRGGSPHVHLASAESYVTVAGEGEVQTFGPAGWNTFALRPGAVTWFEPGIIHRLVNTSGDLEILCVMQNAGLPEAGDAVLIFPDRVLADSDTYDAAARLAGENGLVEAAKRRDLAVEGFSRMLDTSDAEERSRRYARFLERAVALRRVRIPAWHRLWQERPLAEAELTGERLDDIAAGSIDALLRARVASLAPEGEAGYGMCGRLGTYLPEGWAR
jgi:mannose-6-phosphate isomerase-like protein (cupin superfamily)